MVTIGRLKSSILYPHHIDLKQSLIEPLESRRKNKINVYKNNNIHLKKVNKGNIKNKKSGKKACTPSHLNGIAHNINNKAILKIDKTYKIQVKIYDFK